MNTASLRIFVIIMSISIVPVSNLYPKENFITQDADISTYTEISNGIYGGIVPRLELLAGVLSHTKWIKRRGPESIGNEYYRELHDFLKPYKNHKAIKIAKKLTNRGFSYDAPPNFILSLSPLPELQPSIAYSEYLVQRAGNERILDDFREALVDLCQESGFMEFYNNHENEYRGWMIEVFEDFPGTEISSWLQEFFGWNGEQFHIVLAPAMFPQGGYGASYLTDEGLIAVQVTRERGLSEQNPEFGEGSSLQGLSLHELGHSYVNPTVGDNIEYLENNVFEDFYMPVEDLMKKQAYGNYITFLNESILRAVTAIAFAEFSNEIDNIQKFNQDEINRGFYLQDYLTSEILEYSKNREHYSDFKVFLPELFEKMYREKEIIINRYRE